MRSWSGESEAAFVHAALWEIAAGLLRPFRAPAISQEPGIRIEVAGVTAPCVNNSMRRIVPARGIVP